MRAFLLGTWQRRPWLLILAGAVVADMAARVAFHFEGAIVLPVEAGILGAAGAFVLALSGRTRPVHAGARRGEIALSAALGLGALRSLLWGAGVPVWQANVLVLALAIIIAVPVLDGRRAARRRPTLRLE